MLETRCWRYGTIEGEVAVRLAELRMKPRLSIALVTALIPPWVAVSSYAGSCRYRGSHSCFRLPAMLDFSSVPDISNEIVSDEPKGRPPQQLAIDPQPAPHTPDR
jgi:hypothetical protein